MGVIGRLAVWACAAAFVAVVVVVGGYFYRVPAPRGYEMPRNNWWGGGPLALQEGTLAESDGCIQVGITGDGWSTVVWPARYFLVITDGRPVVHGDGRTVAMGEQVALGGGAYDAEELQAVTGETTRCPGPYFSTTGWAD